MRNQHFIVGLRNHIACRPLLNRKTPPRSTVSDEEVKALVATAMKTMREKDGWLKTVSLKFDNLMSVEVENDGVPLSTTEGLSTLHSLA